LKEEKVLLGKINGLFGIKGWIKVFSYTQPRDKVVEYKHWYLGDDQHRQLEQVEVEQGQSHKAGVIAKLKSINDRDDAVRLLNQNIWVAVDQLETLSEDEYYWFQLIGLEVYDVDSNYIGKIKDLMETGANDVIVVAGEGKHTKKEHLIPYLQGQVIKNIDLEQQRMVVEWDTDY